jgi:hypothetical protein
MKISDECRPQPNARNAFGFAHVLSAQDFAQRGPLEIVLARGKLGTTVKTYIERYAGVARISMTSYRVVRRFT